MNHLLDGSDSSHIEIIIRWIDAQWPLENDQIVRIHLYSKLINMEDTNIWVTRPADWMIFKASARARYSRASD